MVGLRHSPQYVCGLLIRCIYIIDRKRGPSCDTEEALEIPISHRVVDQLAQHHDSRFSAFSTEVLDKMNRKHNRSSSPFTTLADKTERR